MKKDGDGYTMGVSSGQNVSSSSTYNFKENIYLDVDEVYQAVNPSSQNNIQYSFNKIR